MEKNQTIKIYKNEDDLNLEKIVVDYTPYLYTITYNICNNKLTPEDTEEIIYETFYTLWKNKTKIQEDKPLAPYLSGIIKNLIRKKFRDNKTLYDIELEDEKIISKIDFTSRIEEREINTIIMNELQKLSENDRKIFKLFYYYNKSSKEIAKILDTKDLIIRSRLHRMRKKLSKRLEEEGYGKKF